jgi:23S rRNA (pseudouridine1915-N3)-methyltransferase
MKIRLLTITHKSPSWIQEGYDDYAKRLPPHCSLELVEIPAEKRTANADLKRITEREGEKMLAAIKPGHRVVALDKDGKAWTSEQLAQVLHGWLQGGQNIDLLVGGPEGLAPACLQRAQEKWSLSSLTFPHLIVRLIIAEQVYRAYSILQNSPYHR